MKSLWKDSSLSPYGDYSTLNEKRRTLFLRYLKSCTVGGTGAVVQSILFYIFTRYLGIPDYVNWKLAGINVPIPWALGIAIILAFTFVNFIGYYFWVFPESRTSSK